MRIEPRALRVTRIAGRLSAGTLLSLSALAVGCGGVQSIVDPKSPQASSIATLWWVMASVGSAVLIAVVALLLVGMFRARGNQEERLLTGRQGWTLVLAGGVLTPAVVNLALLVSSVSIDRPLASDPPDEAMVVEVVGRRWWWDVTYVGRNGIPLFRTANEIRLPEGRPVQLLLKSRDVIHSFWAPNLHGKMDLVPGKVNRIWFQPEETGVYRGQCAEFCGLQHARMAFVVVVEPADRFERWMEHQRQAAREPTDPALARGRDVFLSTSCVLCHTVRGTSAFGRVAPDLTHVGSRLTLAAASIPNTRGHLGGWIVDPQNIKPGNRMPPTNLDPESFQALLDYLESLE